MGSTQKFNFSVRDADSDLFCVFLSSLAYKSQLEIETELRAAGYAHTDVIFFKGRLTSCLVLRWQDVVAVAFRGSTNWREWLNNCNVWLEPTQVGRIHAGFLNTIKKIGPPLIKVIHAYSFPETKIILTGHSRGGALASVFALFLLLNDRKVHRVATFGAPKFGDGEAVSRFTGEHYKPPPTPQKWTIAWLTHKLFEFRVIFIPVCLFVTLRFLWPAIRQHILLRLGEHRFAKRAVALRDWTMRTLRRV